MIFSLHYADTLFKLPIILIKCKKCRRHVKAVMYPHLKDEFDEAKKRIIHHDCIQAARNARWEMHNTVLAKRADFFDLL